MFIFLAGISQGIATGVNFPCTFSRSLTVALQAGYGNSMGTHFVITGKILAFFPLIALCVFNCSLAGLWTWSYYFGNFVGPSLGGLSVETIGFRPTCSAFFSLFVMVMLLDAAYIVWKSRKAKT